MENKYLDIVLNKEKLSDGAEIFVAHCTTLGITSQGKTMDEAIKNIREAITLYLEEQPELYDEISTEMPSFSIVEIGKNAQATSVVR
jgi:predicted RNase H-like HicB family nuclease